MIVYLIKVNLVQLKPGEDGTPEGASEYHEGIDIGTTYTEGFHTAFNIKDGTVVANASDAKYGVYLDIQTQMV